MKLFVAKNLEMFGCPLEIIVMAKTLKIAKEKLVLQYPETYSCIKEIVWEDVAGDVYEVGLG